MEDCDGEVFKHLTPHSMIHWKTPYGLYSPLYGAQGSMGEVEEYLESGSMVGMHRAESLFRELD